MGCVTLGNLYNLSEPLCKILIIIHSLFWVIQFLDAWKGQESSHQQAVQTGLDQSPHRGHGGSQAQLLSASRLLLFMNLLSDLGGTMAASPPVYYPQ